MISSRFSKFKCLLYVAILALSSACTDHDQIIREINNANTTWKAGPNFRPDYPCESIKRLLGYRKVSDAPPPAGPTRLITYSGAALPDEFDARKQWPNCPTVLDIVDQSNCGSCWAVSTASVFSDRLCIGTGQKFTLPMSSEFLMACSDGNECSGGYPFDAWSFIRDTGLVTGGGYNPKIGCQPYELPSCEHRFTNGTKQPCDKIIVKGLGPPCEKKCTNADYKTSFEADFHKVTSVNQYDDIKSVQEDIMKNGPVVAEFEVYEDFLHYKSGVYQHVTGKDQGGHAVRVLGWGTENGTPYWLVANSWNSDWGDKGLFKIKRGSDECGIEDNFTAGEL